MSDKIQIEFYIDEWMREELFHRRGFDEMPTDQDMAEEIIQCISTLFGGGDAKWIDIDVEEE